MKQNNHGRDKIDDWFFKNLLKMIIDSLIVLLRLIRPPTEDKVKPNKPNKPIIPLPDKPMFPWLRKKIDNIFKEQK
jgi:hypothetical protein